LRESSAIVVLAPCVGLTSLKLVAKETVPALQAELLAAEPRVAIY
jgi:hypothetical protein